MRTFFTTVLLSSSFLAGSAFAQSAPAFDPGSGTRVAITAPATPRLPASQLVLQEQASAKPKLTAPLKAVEPRSVGLRTQAELDAAIRTMFRLPTNRRFRVVWEPGEREISVIVDPVTTSEGK
jgi:hypothetical protein